MLDLFFIAIAAAFFWICWAFIKLCEKL